MAAKTCRGTIWGPSQENGKEKLRQCYCLLHREMSLTSILNPFKTLVLFSRNPITILKEEMASLRSYLQVEVQPLVPKEPIPLSLSQESPLEDEVDKMMAETMGEIDAREVEHNEVDGYFAMPPGQYTLGKHLQWRRVNEGRFPKLARAARKYAGMPAAAAPCQRIFS